MNLYGNFNNDDMSNKENISNQEIVYVLSIDEILVSSDINFLMDCKDVYEEIENYEYCALIRDRLIELNN